MERRFARRRRLKARRIPISMCQPVCRYPRASWQHRYNPVSPLARIAPNFGMYGNSILSIEGARPSALDATASSSAASKRSKELPPLCLPAVGRHKTKSQRVGHPRTIQFSQWNGYTSGNKNASPKRARTHCCRDSEEICLRMGRRDFHHYGRGSRNCISRVTEQQSGCTQDRCRWHQVEGQGCRGEHRKSPDERPGPLENSERKDRSSKREN